MGLSRCISSTEYPLRTLHYSIIVNITAVYHYILDLCHNIHTERFILVSFRQLHVCSKLNRLEQLSECFM